MKPDYVWKEREGHYLRHNIDHDAVTQFTFMLKKRKSDAAPLAQVDNADILKYGTFIMVPLTPSQLDISPGDYIGEIKSKFSDANIDKSDDIIIRIEQSVFHDQ